MLPRLVVIIIIGQMNRTELIVYLPYTNFVEDLWIYRSAYVDDTVIPGLDNVIGHRYC